jgi:hypothetical protein
MRPQLEIIAGHSPKAFRPVRGRAILWSGIGAVSSENPAKASQFPGSFGFKMRITRSRRHAPPDFLSRLQPGSRTPFSGTYAKAPIFRDVNARHRHDFLIPNRWRSAVIRSGGGLGSSGGWFPHSQMGLKAVFGSIRHPRAHRTISFRVDVFVRRSHPGVLFPLHLSLFLIGTERSDANLFQ